MPPQDTKKLRIMPEDEIMMKSEAVAIFKQMTGFLERLERKVEAIAQANQQASKNIKEESSASLKLSLTNLEKKVDKVFVESRVSAMEMEHKDRMSKIKDGRDGKDGLPGQKGDKGDKGDSGSPDKPEQIRDKLQTLEGDERLDKSAIKGLEDLDNDVKFIKNRPIPASVAGRDLLVTIDITGDFDGATKTFNIPGVWSIISVALDSYPYGALRNGIDYTYTPTTITFEDPIDATSMLKQGQKCVIIAVKA